MATWQVVTPTPFLVCCLWSPHLCCVALETPAARSTLATASELELGCPAPDTPSPGSPLCQANRQRKQKWRASAPWHGGWGEDGVLHRVSPACPVMLAMSRLWSAGPGEEEPLPASRSLTLTGSDTHDDFSPNLSGFARPREQAALSCLSPEQTRARVGLTQVSCPTRLV